MEFKDEYHKEYTLEEINTVLKDLRGIKKGIKSNSVDITAFGITHASGILGKLDEYYRKNYPEHWNIKQVNK